MSKLPLSRLSIRLAAPRAVWTSKALSLSWRVSVHQPRVLATLFDPVQVSALDPFARANFSGPTPTEAQVALRLGDSAEASNAAPGSSLGTVRVHIKRVIARLGATRAVDGMRMLRQGEGAVVHRCASAKLSSTEGRRIESRTGPHFGKLPTTPCTK